MIVDKKALTLYEKNRMNIKLNRISYSALFSGLGVFLFFLLANYGNFPIEYRMRYIR